MTNRCGAANRLPDRPPWTRFDWRRVGRSVVGGEKHRRATHSAVFPGECLLEVSRMFSLFGAQCEGGPAFTFSSLTSIVNSVPPVSTMARSFSI
jgi:hypothetical protein